MKIDSGLTDTAVLKTLGERLLAQRLRQNLTQAGLAEQAGVSKRTLERLESGQVATQLSSFLRVCRALGLLSQFDALIPEPPPSPIAELARQGRKRQRASTGKTASAATKPWTWGDKPS